MVNWALLIQSIPQGRREASPKGRRRASALAYRSAYTLVDNVKPKSSFLVAISS